MFLPTTILAPLLILLIGYPTFVHSEKAQALRGGGGSTQTKIVGGSNSALNSYPYHVQWKLGCGGTLIHHDLVLTAAHCKFNNNVLTRWPLYVGGDGNKESGTELYAEAAYVHPLYDPGNVQAYDFMVLQLPQAFFDLPKVQINKDRNYPLDGQALKVFGYGLLDENDPVSAAPDRMQEVEVDMIESCSPQYYGNNRINDDIVFCAGKMPNGGKDACQGDSGGPIIDSNGVQVGLVSWGIGCARGNRPGVYARVSAIASWIEYLKCDVSLVPPAYCTQLDVELTLDEYPEETGYTILDQNGQGMVFQAFGSFADVATNPFTMSHQIPPGNYTFVYEDENGDGNCCDFGNGQIVVTSGNKTLTLDGEFMDTAYEAILPNVGDNNRIEGWDQAGIAYSGTSGQQGNARTVFGIKVMIMYDELMPSDLTWKIFLKPPTGNPLLLYQDTPADLGVRRVLDEYDRQVVSFRDFPAATYQLVLETTSGWTSDNGFVRIFLLNNPTGAILDRLIAIPVETISTTNTTEFQLGCCGALVT